MYLAGSTIQRLVTYQVVDGMAVLEGDILLGPAAMAPLRYGMPPSGAGNMRGAVTLASKDHLWPRAEIPYVIDPSIAGRRQDIEWAIAQFSSTPLRIRPRTQADADFVVFRDDGSGAGCSSYLGRIGGPQEIEAGGCQRTSIIHEILHAAGFYHEHSRGDRDQFVTIVWSEIDPDARSNFEKRDGRGQDIGPYDYGSIMHYSAGAFSMSGRPTIIPRDPNARIGQREGMSAGDRAALVQVYGAPGAAPPPPPGPAPAPGPGPAAPAPIASGGFAGSYTSQRGPVTCTQNGGSVQCQGGGGNLLCQAGGTQLDCGWTGSDGSGRAVFQRQPSGVLAGTFGDFLSTNSRGAWDLVPAGGVAPAPGAPPQPPPSQPTPAAGFTIPGWPLPAWPGLPAPAQQQAPSGPTPAGAPAAFGGSYSSTRGPMTCTEGGWGVSCSFLDAGNAAGRADCSRDASGLALTCSWVTFFPPGSGRAALRKSAPNDPNLAGSWGRGASSTDGGAWNATRQ